MPTTTEAERHAFDKQIVSELPAFCHYLLNYTIPEHLKADRFGIRAFHHPEVVKALHELSKEHKVLELIDKVVFKNPTTEPWEGTSTDLEGELRSESKISIQLDRIYIGVRGLGKIMTSLCETEPRRVSTRTLDGRSIYRINPPNT